MYIGKNPSSGKTNFLSIRFEISLGKYLTYLDELILDCVKIMLHVDLAAGLRIGCRKESCIEDTVLDVTTCKLKFLSKESDIHIVRKRCALGNSGLPEHLSCIHIRELELNDIFHTSEERRVNVVLVVGGKNADTVVGFHLLKKEGRLVVG